MATRNVPTTRILRFGPFVLDTHAQELRRNGVKIRLNGRPVQLLAILVENAGELVTREYLQAELWSADTFVDFDHGLHNAIARIREALDDSTDRPKYIETLPRRGYRFVGQLETEAPELHLVPQSVPKAASSKRPSSNVLLFAAVVALIVVAGLALWATRGLTPAKTASRSIAVLPLKNMSSAADQDYFADGMTEELITELSRIPELKVISHTSVGEYKHTEKHLPQIARELGVDTIVEGSVFRDGDRVRITVQLLDGPHDRHLWSADYARPLRNVLDLQKDVAEGIAAQISVKLAKRQSLASASKPVDPEGYDAYLRGRYLLDVGFGESQLTRAKEFFSTAIAKNPDFALAYAGIAEVEINLGMGRFVPRDQAYRATRDALQKAIALDPDCGEAYTVLALLEWRYEWDWQQADRDFQKALALVPNYDCLRSYYATFLAWRGQPAEALAQLTRARELNPSSSFASTELAVHFLARDYPGMVKYAPTAVNLDPKDLYSHFFYGMALQGLGRNEESIGEYRRALELGSGDQDATAGLAYAHARTGSRAAAQEALRELTAARIVSPYLLATVHAGLGDKESALQWLDKAVQEKSIDLSWSLNGDARFSELRSDPRFQALVARTRFPWH